MRFAITVGGFVATRGEILQYGAERSPAPPAISVERRLMRLFDILLALVALLFFAPLLLVIAAAVYVSDPGAILFAQRRIGYGGAYFRCFKFRSMAVNAEALLADLLASDPQARLEWELSHKLKEDPRVTRVGSFLRKSSLDELPQLFNVLRGEMSIVGPRPIVEAEKRRYGRYFEHYCRAGSACRSMATATARPNGGPTRPAPGWAAVSAISARTPFTSPNMSARCGSRRSRRI
jgi:exopolysaccharide production protein ExoY